MIRGTHCVPPSERKAFKLQHRRRVREREEEEEAQGPVKTEPKTEYKPEVCILDVYGCIVKCSSSKRCWFFTLHFE